MFQSCRALLIPVLLLLAACGSPSEKLQPVRIAGGHLIGIPVGPHGPLPGRGDGFEVLQAGSSPDKERKELVYQFALKIPAGVTVSRIVVDDISEEQPSDALVDDGKPWISDGTWRISTSPIRSDDPRLIWIFTVTASVRVYRFTITTSTGKQTVINQVEGYPDFFKMLIRHGWGEKY